MAISAQDSGINCVTFFSIHDSLERMYRLGQLIDGKWVSHSHPSTFELGDRIVAGVPDGDPTIFGRLVGRLESPVHLLYVLHTPRGEAPPGRYQSPAIPFETVKEFLIRFAPFLSSDSRFDLWGHSPSDNATVVWDRHNLVFGYGPLKLYTEELISMGFNQGHPKVPAPHE